MAQLKFNEPGFRINLINPAQSAYLCGIIMQEETNHTQPVKGTSDNNGCRTVLVMFLFGLDVLLGLYYYIRNDVDAYGPESTFPFAVVGILGFFVIVFAVGATYWRKWGAIGLSLIIPGLLIFQLFFAQMPFYFSLPINLLVGWLYYLLIRFYWTKFH